MKMDYVMWDEYCNNLNSLGCKDAVPKGATTMYEKYQTTAAYATVQAGPSLEQTQREKLQEALAISWDEQEHDLRIQFGINDQDAPRTAKELVARIKDGKFVYSHEYETKGEEFWHEWGYGPMHGIQWRDPKVKKDQAGFDAAIKVLSTSYEDTTLSLWVLPLADALAAVRAFTQAKTIH